MENQKAETPKKKRGGKAVKKNGNEGGCFENDSRMICR